MLCLKCKASLRENLFNFMQIFSSSADLQQEAQLHREMASAFFLTQTSLSDAYLSYGTLTKANRLLFQQEERLGQIPLLGPLHRVIFYKAYARLHWQQGDLSGWEHFIRLALSLAAQAGLAHQTQQILDDYGPALQTLLATPRPDK